MTKYENLVFLDPDTGATFSVWHANMEFHHGRRNGWNLIGISADDSVDDEGFSLELACQLIGKTKQADGVQVILPEDRDNDENEEEE